MYDLPSKASRSIFVSLLLQNLMTTSKCCVCTTEEIDASCSTVPICLPSRPVRPTGVWYDSLQSFLSHSFSPTSHSWTEVYMSPYFLSQNLLCRYHCKSILPYTELKQVKSSAQSCLVTLSLSQMKSAPTRIDPKFTPAINLALPPYSAKSP